MGETVVSQISLEHRSRVRRYWEGRTVVREIKEEAVLEAFWRHVVLEPKRLGDLHLELHKRKD
jgi:hypothetical protein